MKFFLIGFFCLAGVSVSPQTVTDSTDVVTESVSCRLQIGELLIEDGHLEDTLDITLEAIGFEPAGGMLKLAVASGQIGILDILPGEIIDSCGWEMFNARRLTVADAARAPRELWQITALAKIIPDSTRPACYAFDRPATLARLVLSSAHLPHVPDTTAAIFFYWESCRDNIVSDLRGVSIMVSDSVYDDVPILFETERNQLPTRYGTPSVCLSSTGPSAPRCVVKFRNGGVRFELKLED